VIHGLRLKISKKGDYFLSMPRRKQAAGAYTHIVFPVDNGTANDRGDGVRGISNNS